MRIISGKYKRRVIIPDKSFRARPTTDFAKESLFNIINNHFNFEEVKFLDLFSGTGSISFEFASRGCRSIHLVESNFRHYSFIVKTAHELGFNQIKTIKGDAFRFLKECKVQFDIIFADPPYDLQGIESIPQLVFEHDLLLTEGWLIVEHSGSIDFSDFAKFSNKRTYGSVNFSIFQ